MLLYIFYGLIFDEICGILPWPSYLLNCREVVVEFSILLYNYSYIIETNLSQSVRDSLSDSEVQ